MTRIGLISDTHIPEAGKELPREVFEALNGVDMTTLKQFPDFVRKYTSTC